MSIFGKAIFVGATLAAVAGTLRVIIDRLLSPGEGRVDESEDASGPRSESLSPRTNPSAGAMASADVKQATTVISDHRQRDGDPSVSTTRGFRWRMGGRRLHSLPIRAMAIIAALVGAIAVVHVMPAEAAHRTGTPPGVTKMPSDQVVKVGRHVTFSATADGYPRPTVQWQVSAGGPNFVDVPGATDRTLRFVATAADNGSRYRAMFSNYLGSVKTKDVTLTVTPEPLALGFAVFQPTGQFQNYRSAVGKLPNFLEWYQSWPTTAVPGAGPPLYWGNDEQLLHKYHLTPLISWSTDNIALTTVVNGASDGEDAAVLAPAAALAKQYRGSLYIRLDWEMNGSWSAWNPGNAAQAGLGETPATFIAMWRHVVNYFRAAGVTNVKWVWSPNVDGGTNTMAAYYPGDNYVDDVALDGYNYAYTQGAPWLTPQQVFGASYAELEGITQKPVIIAETSSVEANSTEAAQGLSKALWIQQLSTYLPTLSNVIAVCWFDQPGSVAGYGTVNFSVNTSSAALGAWERDFVTNREYRGALRD